MMDEQRNAEFLERELCKTHQDLNAMEMRQIHNGEVGSMKVAVCLHCEKERDVAIANPRFIIPV